METSIKIKPNLCNMSEQSLKEIEKIKEEIVSLKNEIEILKNQINVERKFSKYPINESSATCVACKQQIGERIMEDKTCGCVNAILGNK